MHIYGTLTQVSAQAAPLTIPNEPELFNGFLKWLVAQVKASHSIERVATEPRVDPATKAFADRAYYLTRAAWEAPNVERLRQKFDEIALSPGYAEFEMSVLLEGEALELPALELTLPLRPNRWVADRLGKPTFDLLVEALELVLALLAPAGRSMASARELLRQEKPSPEAVARARYEAILGDRLFPSVAQLIMTHLRGQAALLWLVAAIGAPEPFREWEGVAAGEMAVAGMKVYGRLVCPPHPILLPVEEQRYAEFKARAFAAMTKAPATDEDDDASDA